MSEVEIALKAIQLYAEMHPRPTQVNQSQAADMLRLSRGTVSALVRRGSLALNDCGMIPIEQIDRVRAERKAA